MSDSIISELWAIYQDIGRSNGGQDMSDAEKAKFVETLRTVATRIEDQLPVYN